MSQIDDTKRAIAHSGLLTKVLGGFVAALILGVVFGGPMYYFLCLNHTEINQIGVAYDSRTGNVWVQDRPGWYKTSVFVKVAYISLLPVKVTIPSDANVIVSKVVRFKPAGVDEFIRLQGFSYSLSSNLGNTLLGYAFSGKEYPFLEIMQEAGVERVDLPPLPRKQ